MSSHHVIRDKQEPALIIANGEACSMDILGQLLEWSPTVIVLDGAARRVHELGIKIDAILGDFDSEKSPDDIAASQQPVQLIHAPDQNKTDLEKAIEWLIKEGYPAANILWATGLRADHTINNMMSLVKFRDQIDLVMLDDHSRIFTLPFEFKKKYPVGSNISLIPIGVVEGIFSKGLKYELDNGTLESGVRSGSSNQVTEVGWVEISYLKGNLLMMECWD
ncbi:MAG: thiamine diphosphokinase [Bacteroidetes bacterium]|nr:thiamine diphosphokinase [Bacteroidota bacterium]